MTEAPLRILNLQEAAALLRVHKTTLCERAKAGTPLETLKHLGGWADMRMLERYAHHVPGLARKYVNNIGETN